MGDVLDELNGYVLRTEMRGKLSNIMSKSKNKPITVKLIKWQPIKDGHPYTPILNLLRKANIDFPQLKLQLSIENKKVIESERSPGSLRYG